MFVDNTAPQLSIQEYTWHTTRKRSAGGKLQGLVFYPVEVPVVLFILRHGNRYKLQQCVAVSRIELNSVAANVFYNGQGFGDTQRQYGHSFVSSTLY